MVRKAVLKDIDGVENNYKELLDYEEKYGAFTAWKKGVYPTRETARQAFGDGSLYVIEENNEICASMILNQAQPEEYSRIKWRYPGNPGEILVIHLLCVPPSKSGRGFGSEMIRFAEKAAQERKCRALRLDTGAQNKPAVALYTKRGFALAGTSSMAIGGAIAHKNHLFFEKEILSPLQMNSCG